MHGLIDSADAWVTNDYESPAFQLARAGYDVWLANNRGNKYSRKHLEYTTKDEKFWDFSFEQLGAFDLVALTNYVLSKSDYPKLAYIGHS